MATIARADLLRLISETVYVNPVGFERSHRSGECIVYFKPVEELQLSLSLHCSGSVSLNVHDFTKSLPVHVRTVTSVDVRQIDVSDSTGIIESHEFRSHPHRYSDPQETAKELFAIAVASDDRIQEALHELFSSQSQSQSL